MLKFYILYRGFFFSILPLSSLCTSSPLSFKDLKTWFLKSIKYLHAWWLLFVWFCSLIFYAQETKWVFFFFFLDENGFHLKIYCLMLLIPSNLVTVIVLLLMLVFEERHIFNGMER